MYPVICVEVAQTICIIINFIIATYSEHFIEDIIFYQNFSNLINHRFTFPFK
jgi:hypothetical protein